MKKKVLISVFYAAIALSLSACNTVKGFGDDLVRAGEIVRDASIRTQENIKPRDNTGYPAKRYSVPEKRVYRQY